MLIESQQYKLCLDLLESGYTVYIDDIDLIINQVRNDLIDKYGDKVLFGKANEKVYKINF
jgi:hypothetical protein